MRAEHAEERRLARSALQRPGGGFRCWRPLVRRLRWSACLHAGSTLSIPTHDFFPALVPRAARARGLHAVLPQQPAAGHALGQRWRVCLALPAAIAITRYRFPGRDALNGLLLSPLMIPHLVLGVALMRFFALMGSSRQLRLAGGQPRRRRSRPT